MRFICPSCGAANAVPDVAAGYTITCCQCKTEITIPELDRPPVCGLGTTYWRIALAAEAVLVGAAALLWVLFLANGPPAGLPLVGSPPKLAAPGRQVTLRWESGLESAGGHFELASSRVRLVRGGGATDLSGAQVAEKRWDFPIFERGRTPPHKALVVEVTAWLPGDEKLAGRQATIEAELGVEYPGWPEAGAEPRLMRANLSHRWTLRLATRSEEAAYSAWQRRRLWLRLWGCVAIVLAVAAPVTAWLKARRVVNVLCPKCGRVAVMPYLWGTGRFELTPCPHYGQRLRESREE